VSDPGNLPNLWDKCRPIIQCGWAEEHDPHVWSFNNGLRACPGAVSNTESFKETAKMIVQFNDRNEAAQALREYSSAHVSGEEYKALDAVDDGLIHCFMEPTGYPRYLYKHNDLGVYEITDSLTVAREFGIPKNKPAEKTKPEYQELKKAWEDYNMAEEQRKPISERAWNKGMYQEHDPNDPNTARKAAEAFLTVCGLPLVPDAVEQLTEAFLPALRIICERGYHPEGNTWRESGWRGILFKIREKSARLWYRSWIKGGYDDDSAIDLVNFSAFYYRLRNAGKEWGEWGFPGEKTDRRFPISDPQFVGNANQKIENVNREYGSHPARQESTQWVSEKEWNASVQGEQ
jgi:hypothetical protein